jgi:AcrR family transcriptional regulator
VHVHTRVPRNSQAVNELLLTAATEEFTECRLTGARIYRIAERAGANERLISRYYGDKDQLFDTVNSRDGHGRPRALRMGR